MEFAHCDTSSAHLSLHDCIAEKAYFADGKLGFLLSDGFWISPDHPESDLSALVRTDAAKVEYTLEDGRDVGAWYVNYDNRGPDPSYIHDTYFVEFQADKAVDAWFARTSMGG